MAAAHCSTGRGSVSRCSPPSARFVPAGFSPVTLFLAADDLAALERKGDTTDVVGFLTAHVRRTLLQQSVTGPEASRLGNTEPRTVHVPRAVLRRIPDTPGALSGLLSELLADWLRKGGAA